jgi:hypothetical protein
MYWTVLDSSAVTNLPVLQLNEHNLLREYCTMYLVNPLNAKLEICRLETLFLCLLFRSANETEFVSQYFWLSTNTNSLLTPWSRAFLEKVTVTQLVKKFPAFYGTRRFITVFTGARHWSPS